MITVNITASGAVLTAAQPVIADGTAGGITARFHTDSVWQGLALTAVFRTARGDILMPLTKGQCDFPSEATEKCGEVLIGLFGTDGYRTLTSTFCKVKISLGTPTSGEEAKNYTPSLYEQFAGKFARIENMTVSAEKGDVAAVEKTEVDGRINLKFTLPRGATGEQGPQGEPGKDGADGKDGSDYVLTEEDKQEITNAVAKAAREELEPEFEDMDDVLDAIIELQKSYIKEEVIPEQTLEFEYSETYNSTYVNESTPSLFLPAEGETYYVTWDGTEYVCTAATTDNGAWIFLGNPVFFGEADTGEPFLIISAAGGGTMVIISYDTQVSHTVRICKERDGATNLPTVSAEDNGKLLQVVDGKWAAVAVQNVSEVGM